MINNISDTSFASLITASQTLSCRLAYMIYMLVGLEFVINNISINKFMIIE